MFATLERTLAWEDLHKPEVAGKMTSEEILKLCKRAGYSEEVAQKTAAAWAEARLDKDLPP